MSDTFKYYQPGGDAAQSFLNSKLSKNKFHVSKPGGSAYDSQRVVTNQAEIDQFNADNPGGSTGRLSAEQIRDKFGFEYNEEHATQSPLTKKVITTKRLVPFITVKPVSISVLLKAMPVTTKVTRPKTVTVI